LKELFELLIEALKAEVSSPVGRINLVFGIIAVAMVVALVAGHTFEWLTDFLLRVFRRTPRSHEPRDTRFAIVSVIFFFIASLLIVALTSPPLLR
jgi:uncharacterized protein YggT (Ycf19 family)